MLVSIVITSIAVSSLAFAIAKGVKHTESIRLKNVAFLELKRYTEEWRSIIASGYSPINGSNETCVNVALNLKYFSDGEDIQTIIDDNNDFGDVYENATNAELCRKVTKVLGVTDYSTYHNLRTWITWKDNFQGLNSGGPLSSGDGGEKLEFEINQIVVIN